MNDAPNNGRFCLTGDTCRGYDRLAKHPAPVERRDPLCNPCLDAAERDTRLLPLDYLDLAQLQAPSLSQALDTQRRGSSGPPMPISAIPEALQAEIVYVTTMWADELRQRHRLANQHKPYLVGAWHTTLTNPPPPPRRLPGGDVQRAVTTIAPRLRDLARIPADTRYPSGVDDDPTEIAGWEAVHHLQRLHQRARSLLGRTHRTSTVPGSCSECGGELWRDEPRYEGDPCNVYCCLCSVTWTTDEYERYVGLQLAIPARKRAAG